MKNQAMHQMREQRNNFKWGKEQKYKMKKRIIAFCLIIIFVLSITPALASCKRMKDDEAKKEIERLVTESYILNVIYFGTGLKHEITSEDKGDYIKVSEDALYTEKKPLVEKTREIFSSDYAQGIISSAFVGAGGGISSTATYPRYIEDSDGTLTIRRDSVVIDEIAIYDFSTMNIIKNSRNSIIVRIMTKNLEKNQEVQIQLVYEENGWRIDSSTY